MPHRELARRLSGGLTYGEIPAAIKNMVVDTHTANDFIMKPLPNHLFTRDTSCWIYNGVSINPMAKPARQRETNNLRAIYRWHPAFADGDFIKYFGDENINYDHATLEGGDVLVIGRGAVLIGMSERTTPQGVEFLANSLFKHRQAERVIAVELPKHRSCMHLDTVMTHIDVDTFSVYPEVVRKDAQCWTLTPDGRGGLLRTQETDLLHAIEKAVSINQVRLITTGGDAFEAEREQWNDANNVLTIRPGVVIGYERNVWTNEKYDKAGITVLPIPGDELGRGRGGARCMSCPHHRRLNGAVARGAGARQRPAGRAAGAAEQRLRQSHALPAGRSRRRKPGNDRLHAPAGAEKQPAAAGGERSAHPGRSGRRRPGLQ